MPIPALLLSIATVLPLVACVLLLFLGRRLGTPLAGYVGTAFMGASFVCSILAMIDWYGGGSLNGQVWGFAKGPINLPIRWIPIGTPMYPAGTAQEIPGWLDVGIFIDSLTITMFSMVTLVAALVHIFSIGYMQEDGRYPRFFAYLGLFCFSMLGLVLGGTLLHILIFWELVGLCSYLLIGFWYEKKTASNAAIKAFVANRIGDVGFVIGMGILFFLLGNVSLPHLWISLGHAGSGQAIIQNDGTIISTSLLTVMGIGLIFGAIGKSAQFPLHVWLADAMEGPTPVSALIHAATMVAAGVYLIGRIFPILTPDAKLFIAIIGVVTLTMGALVAVAQTDIKKVLAFSTLSQLGYMMLAMGVGSWVGGLFHLMTHAFFKALLFLGAGSVIRAAHHEQEMPEFGGLIRKIPVTAITFLIGVFAISGVGFGRFGFSGFYSKDLILAHAGAFADLAIKLGHSHAYLLLFTLPLVVSFLTPFYMMRCWMLTFWGKPRQPQLYDNARETPVMWGPLVVLAILALLSGRVLSIQELLEGSVQENNSLCRQFDPAFNGFDSIWPDTLPEDKGPDARGVPDIPTLSELSEIRGHDMVEKQLGWWGFTIGLLLAVAIYYRGLGLANLLLKIPPWRWLRTWLYERMYFDELYFGVFVATIAFAAEFVGWFDRVVIDGLVNVSAQMVQRTATVAGAIDRRVVDGAVSGIASFTQHMGDAARAPQTGRIRGYVTVVLGATAIAIALAVIVALSK
jgi:proton-translocating NADH-quinone oxidoreductase chain L